MMNKVAFFSVVHPGIILFLKDFFESLREQSFKDFDIIIVNDGVVDFNNYIDKYSDLSIIEIPFSSTIAKNREYGINYVKNAGYDIIIFGDSDDYFEHNRIAECVNNLSVVDIVFNELDLVSQDGSAIIDNYLSEKIYDIVNIKFIEDKNVLGFSNSALNLRCIDEKVIIPNDIIAVDWYFFSMLLHKDSFSVKFLDSCKTFYRQHATNIVGIGKSDKQLLMNSFRVKMKHYKALKFINGYENIYLEISRVYCKFIEEKIDYIPQNMSNLLWWEDSNIYLKK